MSNDHILTAYDDALNLLKEKVMHMGTIAQQNLKSSVAGVIERDGALCNQVIADDDEEDALEMEIDRIGMDIILRYQPLASDLRMVITSMKAAKNLERISDQTVRIAKKGRKMLNNEGVDDRSELVALHEIVIAMLSDAINAYRDTNSVAALALIDRAKELKTKHKVTSKLFSNALEAECTNYRDYLDLVFICRWLERVGNLSLNIAEDVVFEETSTDIRHGGHVPDSD